jgi:hypothetical protein
MRPASYQQHLLSSTEELQQLQQQQAQQLREAAH